MLHIDLFGAARQLSDHGSITLDISPGATVADAHAAILALPAAQSPVLADVLKLAVLSTEDDILPPTAAIPAGVRLALLPPVAGG